MLSYQSLCSSLPHAVKICGVIKKQSLPKIQQALLEGMNIIGVNYLQEGMNLMEALQTQEKYRVLLEDKARLIEWHFIGKIQSNKIKKIVYHFDLIHSLSTTKHMEQIHQAAKQINKIQNVLIEVNSAKEKTKSGLFPEEVVSFVKQAKQYDSIKILGMMTMGPVVDVPESMQDSFDITKALFLKAKQYNQVNYETKILSMGMSFDYKVAIKCGANLIRVGSLIFGKRHSP